MDSSPSIIRLPVFAAPPSEADGTPCHLCSALCCKYYALQIDTPDDEDDFDAIRWYLLHGKSWIWVDDGDWYLQVDERCRFLGAHDECTIYETRPQICRDYGRPDMRDHPGDPLCDYFANGERHELEFREPAELDAYAKAFLAERRAKREKRAAAARKAWEKRREREQEREKTA